MNQDSASFTGRYFILFLIFISFTTHVNSMPSLSSVEIAEKKSGSADSDCAALYHVVAYNLWKHLCGAQSAGKRSKMQLEGLSSRRRDSMEKHSSQERSRILNFVGRNPSRQKRASSVFESLIRS